MIIDVRNNLPAGWREKYEGALVKVNGLVIPGVCYVDTERGIVKSVHMPDGTTHVPAAEFDRALHDVPTDAVIELEEGGLALRVHVGVVTLDLAPRLDATGMIRARPENREVKYEFTRRELEVMGEQLDQALEEISEIEDNKKEAVKNFASLLETAHKRVNTLSHKRRMRYEMREMECSVFLKPREGTKLVMRPDTGEIIDELALSDAERQRRLDFGLAEWSIRAEPASDHPVADPELASAEVRHAENCNLNRLRTNEPPEGYTCNCYLASQPAADAPAVEIPAAMRQPAAATEPVSADDVDLATANENGSPDVPADPPPADPPGKVRRIRA